MIGNDLSTKEAVMIVSDNERRNLACDKVKQWSPFIKSSHPDVYVFFMQWALMPFVKEFSM